MKYVIECPYCEHSYIVDAKENEEDFQCDNCGAQNGIENIVDRIEDEPVVIEKEVIKTVVVKENEDSEDTSSEDKTMSPMMTAVMVVIICFLVYVMNLAHTTEEPQVKGWQEIMDEREAKAKENPITIKTEEEIKNWVQAMSAEDLNAVYTFYYVPEGSVYGKSDLKNSILSSDLKRFWGTNIQIEEIGFVSHTEEYDYIVGFTGELKTVKFRVKFSDGSMEYFDFINTTDGMKIELDDNAGSSDVKIRTATRKNGQNPDSILQIDNYRINSESTEVLDEEGHKFSEYIIPLMADGEHVCKVNTVLGELTSVPFDVLKDGQVITVDNLQLDENKRNTISQDLEDMWKQVQTAALNYADPAEIRHFFHERITDEEIETLSKQIRMEHGIRGDYEGVQIIDIRIPDDNICAVNYTTFIIPVEIEYVSQNEKHASGVCNSNLTITAVEEEWQVYENYDNSFFTLIQEKIKEQ